MQGGGSAGVRMGLRAGAASLLGSCGRMNLSTTMTSYHHLMYGRRLLHCGMKPQRTNRLPKRNSLVQHRLKSQQVNSSEGVSSNGARRSDAGRWNLLVILVGRGQHVQALEELVELAQVLMRLVTRQFEVHTTERIRRGLQLYSAYSRLWGEEAAKALLNNLRRMLVSRGRHLLLSAVCFSQYDWEANIISDDFLKSSVRELDSVGELCKATVKCGNCGKRQIIDQQMGNIEYCMCEGQLGYTDTSRVYDSWEPFIERSHHIVWRKKHEVHQHLYAYKVYGAYDDVSLSAFMEVQLNSDFRTEWDDTALELRILDSHKDSNSDLIYWLVKYPHFFANRDYIYKRRFLWNEEKQEAVIMNIAISPDHIPEEKGIHRVNEYWSTMVIRAKENANKPGLEYTLTYFDNPGTSLPQWLTNFIAVTGFPSFLQKVHEAALSLQAVHERGNDVYISIPEELRHPTKPKLETPKLEEPTDIDVLVRKDVIPAQIVAEVISSREEVKSLECDALEETVSSPRLTDDLTFEQKQVDLGDLSEKHSGVETSTESKSIEDPSLDSLANVDIIMEAENKLHTSQSLEDKITSVEEVMSSRIENSDDQTELLEESKTRAQVENLISERTSNKMDEELLSADSMTQDEPCDLKNITISSKDKSLHVQRGMKNVDVDILEGMEVVAPDLDEQTFISRNVEKLTVKAMEELENKTVLLEKIKNLKTRLKLFHKHANQKKESSLRKMHEFEERSHYEHFDEQTSKHLEKLFKAVREVLDADKEMRTGKGLLQKSSDKDVIRIYNVNEKKADNEAPSGENDSDSLSDRKKSDERNGSSSRRKSKSKSSDDPPPPPPPPPPQAPMSFGISDSTASMGDSEKTTSNEIGTINGMDSIGEDKSVVSSNVTKSWLHIPYLTNWWVSEQVPKENINAENKLIQRENACEESSSSVNSVVDQIWYVVGLGWVFQTKSEIATDTEQQLEEEDVSKHSYKLDNEGKYNWYWYPVDGVYRLYGWVFKSSKVNV